MRYYRGLEPQRLPLAPRHSQLPLGTIIYVLVIATLALATILALLDRIA